MHLLHSLRLSIIIGVLCIGVIARLFSMSWNYFPHGDVLDDVKAGVSFQQDHSLVIEPYEQQEGYLYDIKRTGGMKLLMQHPPLWSIAGAVLNKLAGFHADANAIFLSFRLLSFACGILLLGLVWKVARRIGIDECGRVTLVTCLSLSYIMIDYAGNGAFYSAHALLYLWWIMSAMRQKSRWLPVEFAMISAIGYLLNFQTLLLVPASLLMVALKQRASWQSVLTSMAIYLVLFLSMISPYLVRNAIAFGDPFFPHYINKTYVYQKASIPYVIEQGIVQYQLSLQSQISLIKGMFIYSFPNNLYYVARKLFILVPFAFLFFPFAIVDYAWSSARLRRMFPIITLLTLHCVLIVAWPVVKFRFFVPLVPLVYLVSFEHMQAIIHHRTRLHAAYVVCVVLSGALSIMAYFATPTHTAYYDGAITTDPFGENGELLFVRETILPPKL